MRLTLIIFTVLTLLGTAGCTVGEEAHSDLPGSSEETQLIVFAAASLSQAFGEIATSFESQHPNLKVVLNLAGSQQLAQQIGLGAPADIFASANQHQMQVAIDAGRISKNTALNFAHNQLVAIAPIDNPAQVKLPEDLSRPGLRLVLADTAVPAGQYTLQFLSNVSNLLDATYLEKVRDNVASYEQNVRAVLTKVSLNEADAGVVYKSDLLNATGIIPIPIPDSLNTMAIYPIAPLADSPNADMARAFIDFVSSLEGQAIMVRHGFIAVDPG